MEFTLEFFFSVNVFFLINSFHVKQGWTKSLDKSYSKRFIFDKNGIV